ncbi:MAG: hypothetical protein J6T96_03075 [Bacteroidales bacterium]|nr:hypothetical protein [Bacteroidales bacterium]
MKQKYRRCSYNSLNVNNIRVKQQSYNTLAVVGFVLNVGECNKSVFFNAFLRRQWHSEERKGDEDDEVF